MREDEDDGLAAFEDEPVDRFLVGLVRVVGDRADLLFALFEGGGDTGGSGGGEMRFDDLRRDRLRGQRRQLCDVAFRRFDLFDEVPYLLVLRPFVDPQQPVAPVRKDFVHLREVGPSAALRLARRACQFSARRKGVGGVEGEGAVLVADEVAAAQQVVPGASRGAVLRV